MGSLEPKEGLMLRDETFQMWYATDEMDQSGCKIDPARQAFVEALEIFKSELSKDQTKIKWLEESSFRSVQEVLVAVLQDRAAYERRIEDSPTRQSIGRLSESLLFYGNIMDVLIQQHPEYVALVWGAMRFLVVGVANHHRLMSRLSNGLCQIAAVLPRAELILRLYPISAVQNLVSRMYANILRFLIRSLRWYQESKLAHFVHSITRPAELRFDDVIADIRLLSRNMTDLALASGHAEQRDMHIEQKQASNSQRVLQKQVDYLTRLVEQIRETLVTDQAINASARIELRQDLSSIQLGQLLSLLSNSTLLDPIKSLQTALFMRDRRRRGEKIKGPPNTRKFVIWDSTTEISEMVILQCTRKLRFEVKDFCSESILRLQQKQVPAIWAVKAIESYESTENMTSTIDLLKYLVSQALPLNQTIHTDATMTPRLKSYYGAQTESDWFNVLASVIQGIPLLHIIIDLELLHPSLLAITPGFSWPVAFRALFAGLVARNIKTIVKVTLVSYGSPVLAPKALMNQEVRNWSTSGGTSGRSRSGPEKSGRKAPSRRQGNRGRRSKTKIDFR